MPISYKINNFKIQNMVAIIYCDSNFLIIFSKSEKLNYNFINARELVFGIWFIDLDVRGRIWQHFHFSAIGLNFVIKSMIKPSIPLGGRLST